MTKKQKSYKFSCIFCNTAQRFTTDFHDERHHGSLKTSLNFFFTFVILFLCGLFLSSIIVIEPVDLEVFFSIEILLSRKVDSKCMFYSFCVLKCFLLWQPQRQHSCSQDQFPRRQLSHRRACHAKQDAWLRTNLGENDSLWWNNQGRNYHVPFCRRRENAEMSIWKQLKVITMASTAVYRHVHIYSEAVHPNYFTLFWLITTRTHCSETIFIFEVTRASK